MEGAPSTLGEVLCARRQELGLSLSDVAKSTRISRAYLRALEEDRPDAFPAETYRIGFLRTYAGILGLKMSDLPAHGSATPTAEAKALPLAANDLPRSSGRLVLSVMAVVVLVAAAILSASVFRAAQEPPPVAAESDAPEGTAIQEDVIRLSEMSRAGENVPETSHDSLNHAAEAPLPVSHFETVSGETSSLRPEARSADLSSLPQQRQTVSAPDDLVANVIRLRALGPNRLELVLDSRPPQRYELKAQTELSWRLRHSAHIRVDNPSTVELWFGDERLDMGGKSQIFLKARQEPGGEGS